MNPSWRLGRDVPVAHGPEGEQRPPSLMSKFT